MIVNRKKNNEKNSCVSVYSYFCLLGKQHGFFSKIKTNYAQGDSNSNFDTNFQQMNNEDFVCCFTIVVPRKKHEGKKIKSDDEC